MRQFVIKFIELDDVVRCSADFGEEQDGTKQENIIANEAHIMIQAALRFVKPDKLSAYGSGSTEKEAFMMAQLQRELKELEGDV